MADTGTMMLSSSLHIRGRSFSITFHSDAIEEEPSERREVIGENELAEPVTGELDGMDRLGFQSKQ